MLSLWEAFNDVAEGFGLTVVEFREILQCATKEYLGINDKSLADLADAVFKTFDDDQVKHFGAFRVPCYRQRFMEVPHRSAVDLYRGLLPTSGS